MNLATTYVLGVGLEGKESLSKEALRLIEGAEILYGSKRLLGLFPDHPAKKVVIGGDIPAVVQESRKNLGVARQAVLASGDPLFFGVAESLIRELGKPAVKVIPNLSSLQIAFSKINEGSSEAVFVGLHAKGLKNLFAVVPHAKKVGILTDPTNTPQRIASELMERIGPRYTAFVLENLGATNERVRFGELHEIASQTFDPLNVVVLIRKESKLEEAFPITGIPDEAFFQRTPDKGLITKSEVRAVSLAKMALKETSVVFDVGAGSGSVGIEAARIAKSGMTYAIEKNHEALEHLKANRLKLGVANLEIVPGEAPKVLCGIPEAPDTVFVGGSRGNMLGILEHAAKVLRPYGRIVLNLVTTQALLEAQSTLKSLGFEAEVTLVQVSKSKDLLGQTRLAALNPVFIVSGWRSTP